MTKFFLFSFLLILSVSSVGGIENNSNIKYLSNVNFNYSMFASNKRPSQDRCMCPGTNIVYSYGDICFTAASPGCDPNPCPTPPSECTM
jgi:hypothetical protein